MAMERLAGVFSDDAIYNELNYKLAELAGEWRETKNPDVVRRYHHVLLCLMELGWDDNLDVELELPDDLMPAEYFQRYERRTEKSPS